ARQAMHVVGGSIERIDDPAEFGTSWRNRRLPFYLPICRVFLAQKVVIWKRFMKHITNRFLSRQIGLRNQVTWPFLPRFKAVSPMQQGFAAQVGGFETGFQRRGRHE